jgi:hypothetical protein
MKFPDYTTILTTHILIVSKLSKWLLQTHPASSIQLNHNLNQKHRTKANRKKPGCLGWTFLLQGNRD